MKAAKREMLRLFGGLVLFFFTIGSGYVYRTWECRSDLQKIYVAAPGYQAADGELPGKLYALQVTRCTLPEQWGGHREPAAGYP